MILAHTIIRLATALLLAGCTTPRTTPPPSTLEARWEYRGGTIEIITARRPGEEVAEWARRHALVVDRLRRLEEDLCSDSS